MKKTQVARPVEAVIDELEEALSDRFGQQFVIEITKICGMHSLRDYNSATPEKKLVYAAMLRGAWYASQEMK